MQLTSVELNGFLLNLCWIAVLNGAYYSVLGCVIIVLLRVYCVGNVGVCGECAMLCVVHCVVVFHTAGIYCEAVLELCYCVCIVLGM
jgi:hypothetical protein